MTEDTSKFFNFPEWTVLDGGLLETPLLSNESNSQLASYQATGFELRLTLPGD